MYSCVTGSPQALPSCCIYLLLLTPVYSILFLILHSDNVPLYSYLKELVPEINQCVDKFLDNLESSASTKSPISLCDEFSFLTLNVISKVSGR